MRIDGESEQRVEMLVDERADLAVRQACRRRIDREPEPALRPRVALVREHHELPGDELAPVVVAHRTGHQQHLPLLDLTLQKRLARPRALEQAALVAQDGPEDAQPAPRRQHAGGDHLPDAAHLLAHPRSSQRRDGGRVEIAVRSVIQQIADRADPEPRQRLGALRPDALQIFHRRRQRQRHFPSPLPGSSPAVPRPFPGRSPAYQALGVGWRVERLEIVEPLPCADEPNRYGYRALHGDHAPALRGAVELRDDEARERQGGGEGLRLLNGILAHRRVEHQQRLVRCAQPPNRALLRDDPHHLFQLVEQPFFGMQPARRVDEHAVDPAGARRRHRVERHCRRVRPGAADAGNAQPVRPDLELLPCPGPDAVVGGDQAAPTLTYQPARQLRDGSGLPDAVHAEHDHHGRRLGCARQRAGIAHPRQDAHHGLLQCRPRVPVGGPRHLLENLRRRCDAEVSFEQDALGLLARARVAPAEHAAQPLPQRRHHGRACWRRHAHSVANAAIATTNSHQRSRSAELASRSGAPPRWACTSGAAGRHSSEYVSTTTTPRSAPCGAPYAYTPGGSDSSARPVASNRSVSMRLLPPAVSVTTSSCGGPDSVQRHTIGIPLGASRITGTNFSHLPSPPVSSQSAKAATTARYASALAPPRNAQRNSPDAATAARRAPPGCDSTITGRAAPRRARRAVSTTTAALSPVGGRARSDTAAAGGSESHATPASAPASGDGSGARTYQSPSWPRWVGHVSTAPLVGNRSSAAGSPIRTTSRAPATACAAAAAETGVRPAASRQPDPSDPDCTSVRTGTRATSLSVRARNRLSQSGGAASSTTEGGGLTSSTNQRASSRGSESPATPSSRTSSACQPAGREPGKGEGGRVTSVERMPLSGIETTREVRRRDPRRTTSVPFPPPGRASFRVPPSLAVFPVVP